MRWAVVLSLLVAGGVTLAPSPAAAQSQAGFVQGFGGATVGGASPNALFGGEAGVNLTPRVQLVGEAGYMRDTRPSGLLGGLEDLGSSLSGIGFRISAVYFDGGMRVVTDPRATVRGYVEGTAGVARVRPRVDLGLGLLGGLANQALGLLDTTQGIVGGGGGVIIQPGRVFVDLGYRYKRILTSDPINVNQLRAAVGVAF